MSDKYQKEVEKFSQLTPQQIGMEWACGSEISALFGNVSPRHYGCITQIKHSKNAYSTGDTELDAILRADERIPNPMAKAVDDLCKDEDLEIDPAALPVFAEINRMIDEKFPHVRS